MNKRYFFLIVAVLLLSLGAANDAHACTNMLISKGASADGSVMITYSADGSFTPMLMRIPARDYEPGEMEDVVGWEDTEIRGQVKSIAHSYAIVGLMNEHQVTIGETTTGGREELHNPDGLLDYDGLIYLALKRSKTAREAIKVMDELVQEYGYCSEGESFSVADKNEVWLFEIIGKGKDRTGAVWVAARVPDGYISNHANQPRITTFPMDDPENWLYAKDVVDFAVEKGYYDPASGKPFSWRDAYHGTMDALTKRVCDGRTWAAYNLAAPSLNLSPDYFRGVEGAEEYPLFIKPDNKLTVKEVMNIMRNHFEGSPYDMSKGIDAGPFGSPYRWRGLRFEVDGTAYSQERPISTMQAGFVMLCQSRDWLPDAVGGVYWYTPDDANTSVFLPLYCSITELPEPYLGAKFEAMELDKAWWIFQLVSNMAYDRYSWVIPDIRAAQDEWEQTFLDMQPLIDETAAKLMKTNPDLAVKYLTHYSVSSGEELFKSWKELWMALVTKYKDFYINDPVEGVKYVPYPEDWTRKVLAEKGEMMFLPEEKKEEK